MEKGIRFIGLDVHAATITVAVAEDGRNGEVRGLGTIPNRPESVRKLVAKLGPAEKLRCCYEAGPCGYVLYWQLVELGVACEVIAPTLIPTKAGDRVKTDRRDAEKLARCYRAGELTAVWVPDGDHEALRDLVRAREAAKQDQLRARNRLSKFLLRQGLRRPDQSCAWGVRHMEWLKGLKFDRPAHEATLREYLGEVEHQKERVARLEQAIADAVALAPPAMRTVVDALQALRGVRMLTAVTIVAEVGRLSRFGSAPELMGYSGLVPSEHSSGGPDRARRGGITKTGNTHLRRVLVESAWTYRFKPNISRDLRQRQKATSAEVQAIAWKAQHRLYARFWKLSSSGKPAPKVATAVARELLGFVWAVGLEAERAQAAAAGPRPCGAVQGKLAPLVAAATLDRVLGPRQAATTAGRQASPPRVNK